MLRKSPLKHHRFPRDIILWPCGGTRAIRCPIRTLPTYWKSVASRLIARLSIAGCKCLVLN